MRQMTHFPLRLFPATTRVKTAFERLFEAYDTAGRRSAARRLKMRSAALELLLALVEAPHAPASPKGRRNPKVDALVKRMRVRPEDDYTLEAMAREVALSTVALNEAFKRDGRPISGPCSCPVCRNYSRAYIRHLLKAKEMLGMRLCVMHNLYFYNHMMEEIREAIRGHRYESYKKAKLQGFLDKED